MKLTLTLSGGLRAVLGDLPEQVELELDRPAMVWEVLLQAGINPRLAMMVFVDGRKVDQEYVVEYGCEIVVVGPAAGG